jgi:6-phosphogluconate dehydrogenase
VEIKIFYLHVIFRRIAGSAVDDFIEQLLPLLEKGDVIIDGGNSDYHDSIRRAKYLDEKGLLFVGTGVSGGEEGARYGPSLMPGGNPKAWPLIKDIFQVGRICVESLFLRYIYYSPSQVIKLVEPKSVKQI